MIKLIKSSFYHEAETKQALADFIIKQDIFSMNVECEKFEKAFAEKQGRRHAIYISNGSVANLLLIQAMLNSGKLTKGDKVGFSALTWPTNVMPLLQLGLVPVAIDCNIENLNVSPKNLKEHIKDIKALFLTNVLGFCDDLSGIRELCAENDVTLLEDNCEALGSKVDGEMLGNFGLASTFSFFVGHHISTIEGGMVCTDDEELYEHLVIARSHGWDRNLSTEAQQRLRTKHNIDTFYAKYAFYEIASNFRPTEINGFLGNIQIQYWDEIVERRKNNFKQFNEAATGNDDFYSLDASHMDIVSSFAMPIICKTPELAKEYIQKFEQAEVEIRPIIAGNMTKQPFYKKHAGQSQPLPNSDLAHDNGFYFGNNPEMTDNEVEILCSLLKK